MSQYISQYPRPNWGVKLSIDLSDMSLVSDERNYNEEVVFSPYLIAQTYGNRLPFSFDTNNVDSVQPLSLTYKEYNFNNVFVSLNYYNPENLDLSCLTANTSCDIGLTGIDNGLVTGMTGQTITFTNGIDDFTKFDRLYFDRRLKLFQVTGYTSSNIRFSGFDKTILYEVVSKNENVGYYHELYGGFYQGFYKLFGYDYDIFPERMNKGWAVEMLLKPRLVNEFSPSTGETTLNEIYPQNKNIFFYMGTRAENKFYHHADGFMGGISAYTRVTSGLTELETCSCCNTGVTNSRCIYVYPPRSNNGEHDPHVNYGCNVCGCNSSSNVCNSCGCPIYESDICGWECKTHNCESSIQSTCETDPLFDSMSNAISFKLCGNPNNPSIGVKVLRFTGDCITTGSCETSGITYQTGYTITEYCSPTGIYDYCENVNPTYLDTEHWFLLDAVWERYTWLDTCDLFYRGGLGDITETRLLESLANNSMVLIAPPYTQENYSKPSEVELVNLNEEWLINKDYRKGRLKIYINGRRFFTIENFEEIIPRGLNTDKEKQVGVPFNISWGGGTQGLRENLTFSSTTGTTYIQDPESLPTNDLSGTTYSGLTTNILLEQNFGGTFEGGISQFRMYISPLSAPEVKHNFNLLKDTFDMFNPDCPDCGESFCPTNDFTYVISDSTPLQYNALKVGDFLTILGNPQLEDDLIYYAVCQGFNIIQLYDLYTVFDSPTLSNYLDTFLSKVYDNDLYPVAILGEGNQGFDLCNTWEQTPGRVNQFWGVNKENEFWWYGTQNCNGCEPFSSWISSMNYVRTTYPHWHRSAYIANPTGNWGLSEAQSMINAGINVLEVTNYNSGEPNVNWPAFKDNQLTHLANASNSLGVVQSFVPLWSSESVFSGPYFQSNGPSLSTSIFTYNTNYNNLILTNKNNLNKIGFSMFMYSTLSTYLPCLPPTPTPSITPTLTPTPTPSITPTLTPTPTNPCVQYITDDNGDIITDENGNPIVSELNPCASPTPTPTQTTTPTITPTQTITTTPTQSVTPTITPTVTQTTTPTPTQEPLYPLTLYIQPLSGGQAIIFDGITYTAETTVNIPLNTFFTIQAVPIPGYMFVGWNIFGGSFSSTGQSTTVSISLTSGANLAPSYSVDPNYDALEDQMTTNLINYQNATVNDWVVITQQEYNNIVDNVPGVIKIGNNDTQVNTRDVATGFNTTTFGTIDADTPLTIPTGYYVVGFVAESWNQNGQVQLGYTTTYHTGTPTYMSNSPNVIGGMTMFYVRKRPSGVEAAPASVDLYPVLNFLSPAYPNSVLNTYGWQTPDGGTTWLQTNPSFQTAKIQILITNIDSWP